MNNTQGPTMTDQYSVSSITNLTAAAPLTAEQASQLVVGTINFAPTPNGYVSNWSIKPSSKKMWAEDIAAMHAKFGVNPVVNKLADEQLGTYLKFRLDMVQEEVTEALDAFKDKDADGIVDALIDNIVFAIGTLDAFGVDAQLAWDRVHAANMAKFAGIKVGRPNPYGFPDLMKPEGWKAPSHVDNVGLIAKALKP